MGQRILVVDDHQESTESLSILLTMFNHEVREAANGPTAIEIAREFKPSVGILDIGMPGMNGYELAETLLSMNEAPITLIAITGQDADSDLDKALAAGFKMRFVKPVDFPKLRTALAEIGP